MYGWWQSFEHFSYPGSNPVAVSVDLGRVEAHAREHRALRSKSPVIGSKSDDGDWIVEYRVDSDELHRQKDTQRTKYDRARRGGTRGNLGPVPPVAEVQLRTIDLDEFETVVSESASVDPHTEETDRTPGHVYVVLGRIESFDADAVIVPTDQYFNVEPHWFEVTGDPKLAKPQDWPARGFARSSATERVWFISVFDDERIEAERLSKRVQELVRDIARSGLTHAGSRWRLRLSIPVLGIGRGGMSRRRGAALDVLLQALWESVQDNGVDIVLVAADPAVFSAAQHRRRDLAKTDRGPSPWGLTDDTLNEAKRLGRLARDGHLALFLGAGVSQSAGLPGWTELLEKIAERVGVNPELVKGLGDLDAAELLDKRADARGLGEIVREVLDTKTEKISLAHGLLAGLNAHEVITTNYDALFERAVSEAGAAAPTVLPWESVEVGRPWLLKLHGDLVWPDSIVLTRRDFVLFDARSRPAGSLLQATLMTKHLLIVGASLADDNVIRLAMEVDDYLYRNRNQTIVAKQGTFVDVSGQAARRDLWSNQFDWYVCKAPEFNERIREMEIFLDVLAAYAARNAPWLLDPRFAGLLSKDEQRVVDDVRAALDQVPSGDDELLAPLREVRKELGGG